MTANTETMPVPGLPETQERERLASSYSFVFCKHVPEYATEIADALKGNDIIAFEFSGLDSEEERAQWQHAFTRAIASDANEDDKQNLDTLLATHTQAKFFSLLCQALAGSNAQVVCLDILSTDPNHSFIDEYARTQSAYVRSLQLGEPVGAVAELLLSHAQVAQQSFIPREAKMSQQLTELGNLKAKVGVMLGHIHTPVYSSMVAISEARQTFRFCFIRSASWFKPQTSLRLL